MVSHCRYSRVATIASLLCCCCSLAVAPFSFVFLLFSCRLSLPPCPLSLCLLSFSFSLSALPGSAYAGAGIPFGIEFLDTDLVFMPIEIWLLLTGLALLERFNTLCRMVCSVGNHIILVRQYVIIGIMSLALLVLTGKEHMMVFIVLSLWGPPALIPIFSALKHASRLLQVKRAYLLLLVLFPSILVLFLFVVLYMYVL